MDVKARRFASYCILVVGSEAFCSFHPNKYILYIVLVLRLNISGCELNFKKDVSKFPPLFKTNPVFLLITHISSFFRFLLTILCFELVLATSFTKILRFTVPAMILQYMSKEKQNNVKKATAFDNTRDRLVD